MRVEIYAVCLLMLGGGSATANRAFASESWTLKRALNHVVEEAPDAKMAQLRYEKARAQWDE
ncbi:MAG: hypothetical protein KDM64_05490, partial [Verrucomicrobiae bacterium]|nr:hypothetical protein [Verrucomicrobiae bacterium]